MIIELYAALRCPCGDPGLARGWRLAAVARRALEYREPSDRPVPPVRCPACGETWAATHLLVVEGGRQAGPAIPLEEVARGGKYDKMGRRPGPAQN